MLKIESIKKSFGTHTVLENISFSAKKGDIIGLIGKSGCGKSTLIKILVGHYKSDAGKIYYNEEHMNNQKLRNRVGYTTQENSFYELLTVQENMEYFASLYKKTSLTKIKEILTDVKLYKARHTLATNISGGMKRRLDFAISLIHDPELLILDEPTTGLDPILVTSFWKTIKKIIKDKQIIAIVSSHILAEIEENCNKVIVMQNGIIANQIHITKKTNLLECFK